MRSGIELSQFRTIFLPSHGFIIFAGMLISFMLFKLVVFFSSSVSVVLLTSMGSPGQRVVTVESSSLLHRGRFIDFNCCP